MGIKKSLLLPALVVGSVGAGVAASSAIAGMGVSADSTTAPSAVTAANTTNSATSASNDENRPAAPDPNKGGHTANGKTEEVLTGDTLTKATDAAKAAVSDATVDRAETDAEGAAYEVHMTKSDGSHVTVKLDENFKVTDTEEGFGTPPAGQSTKTN